MSCDTCYYWLKMHEYKYTTCTGSTWRCPEGICKRDLVKELGCNCDPVKAIQWAIDNEYLADEQDCKHWEEA